MHKEIERHRAIGGGQAGALAHARVRVVAGRTEGAADVFARFLELMAARGRGDGKIASLAPGGADGRSAGPQAGEPLVPHSYVTVGRSGRQCTHSLSPEVGRSVGIPRTNDRYMT